MIETTSPADRKQSTRRLFLSDGFTEYEISVTMRQDRARPDEPTDLVITGEAPQNGALADAFVDAASRLNGFRPGTELPVRTFEAMCAEG